LLTATDQAEVLEFLAKRLLHTVNLTSLIRDNGMESPLNRGCFYGARDEAGRLEGVALIGHATLIEAHTDRAIAALAHVARQTPRTHMIMAEQELISCFLQYYSVDGEAQPNLVARERLFALTFPLVVHEAVSDLREATSADLDLLVPVQAELALAESGVDPLATDPQGFRERCARRIAQRRTWMVCEREQLLFKAELQAVTPAVIYLEGIYVNPALRGQGLGVRCLSQLCRTLLRQTDTISLLVNEQHSAAQQLYRKVGFRAQGYYDTIFLAPGC
jgi:predicted GNAT family acetyltransferase